MPINSVNTNSGALIALQFLNRTNSELDSVQKRVSTGQRIADNIDDGAAFSVAQGLRSDVAAYNAVSDRLSAAKGLVSVASAAATSVSDTLAQLRDVTTKLADASLSTDERTQYGNDYVALANEINNFVAQASFNGTNLADGATTVNTIRDISGTAFAITGYDIDVAGLGVSATAPAQAAAATAIGAGGAIEVAEGRVSAALNGLGASSRALDNQLNFISKLSDATEVGIGDIVDADLAKESARLQSLQIRQQLGTQSLSIANQAPSILLGLFN